MARHGNPPVARGWVARGGIVVVTREDSLNSSRNLSCFPLGRGPDRRGLSCHSGLRGIMHLLALLGVAMMLPCSVQSFTSNRMGLRQIDARCCTPVLQRRAATPQMFGPGGGGGFLNVGTPEMFVIGAVAYALIGPKELFKLSKQAGEFIAEWRTLGAQAQAQFKEALEAEMQEDEKPTAAPPTPLTDSLDNFPTLADMAEKKEGDSDVVMASEQLSTEEVDVLTRQAFADLGDPESNRANFEEQLNGQRNVCLISGGIIGKGGSGGYWCWMVAGDVIVGVWWSWVLGVARSVA